MKNNIENRVTKLEDRVGINDKAETLEKMLEKFWRFEYGIKPMSIVAGCMNAPDKEKFFDGLRLRLPGPLVDEFTRIMTELDSK